MVNQEWILWYWWFLHWDERFSRDQEEFLANLEKLDFWKYVIVAITNANRLGNDPHFTNSQATHENSTQPLRPMDQSNDYYQVKMDHITKLVEGIQEACNHQPCISEVLKKQQKKLNQSKNVWTQRKRSWHKIRMYWPSKGGFGEHSTDHR